MKVTITQILFEIAEESGMEIVNPLTDDTVLLECGLDSLGFAILVARLEEKLGYDPFTIMREAYYPRTFGDFISIYKQYEPK